MAEARRVGSGDRFNQRERLDREPSRGTLGRLAGAGKRSDEDVEHLRGGDCPRGRKPCAGKALAVVAAAYEEATGQTRTVRKHAPWLRSMRGEREVYQGVRPRLTGVERILVISIVIVVLTFEVWLFFFSGSPIDNRSGRSASSPMTPTLA